MNQQPQANYSLAAVATIIGGSESSVRNLIKANRLRAVQIGVGEKRKRYSVPPDALEEYQKANDKAERRERDARIMRDVRAGRSMQIVPERY